MNENLIINAVPCTTWNWLKMNKDFVTLNASFREIKANIDSLPEGVTISSLKDSKNDFPKVFSGICNIATPKSKDNRKADGSYIEKSELSDKDYSLQENHPVQKIINDFSKETELITIKGKVEKPLILSFNFETSSVATQFIHATENSESTIILVFKGNSETSLVQTKIITEENAKIHIVKVQLMEENSMLLDDTGFTCSDNSKANFTQIELGGNHNNSGLHVTLNGYQSKFVSNVAYLCSKNQHLDMNHIVNHYGKKSECVMKVNGTLKDESVKTYRGTIDFKNGCCGSKGNEMEESLVLSPKVINKSLPNILCDEEDVEGEHGATIGRLSSDILFYMQSRGISESEAEKLMSIAKIQAAADLIPDDNVKNLILDFLDK